MFDQLFSLPAVRARHRSAPRAEARLRFLAHLAELGLSRRTLLECAPLLLVIVEKLDLANCPIATFDEQETTESTYDSPHHCHALAAGGRGHQHDSGLDGVRVTGNDQHLC